MDYLINEYVEDFGNAGSKARRDISKILEANGAEIINLPYDSKKSHLRREVQTWTTLMRYWNKDSFKGRIIVQFPLRLNVLDQVGVLHMVKKFRAKVVIIHDLESLRKDDQSFIKSEVTFLNRFDLVISHSENMTRYSRSNGVKAKIRNLYLFDYLSNQPNKASVLGDTNKKSKVFFAGNLEKSLFLERIPASLNERLYVYGLNATEKMKTDLKHFMGFVEGDSLPTKLKNGWGLVWDGPSPRQPKGVLGNYLAYNAPHKTSLYIAADVPVIVWSGAANADFIKKNSLGIVVDSLEEVNDKLESLTDKQYNSILRKVSDFSAALQSGKMIMGLLRNEG